MLLMCIHVHVFVTICSVSSGGIRRAPVSDSGKVDWYALIPLP